jgi:hypothetical protein
MYGGILKDGAEHSRSSSTSSPPARRTRNTIFIVLYKEYQDTLHIYDVWRAE